MENYFKSVLWYKKLLLFTAIKQSELTSKCRHENKNFLANIGNSGKRNNDSTD